MRLTIFLSFAVATAALNPDLPALLLRNIGDYINGSVSSIAPTVDHSSPVTPAIPLPTTSSISILPFNPTTSLPIAASAPTFQLLTNSDHKGPPKFHFTMRLTEYCNEQGDKRAKANITNDDWHFDMEFPPGQRHNLSLPLPLAGFAPLHVGPYYYDLEKMIFAYYGLGTCEWDSDWSMGDCGACKLGNWTAGSVDCKSNPTTLRYQDMDCAFDIRPGWNQTTVPAGNNTTSPSPKSTETPQVFLWRGPNLAVPSSTSENGFDVLHYNFSTTEECNYDGHVKAKGLYINGNIMLHMNLPRDQFVQLENTGKLYPSLDLKYSYEQSKLMFAYNGTDIGFNFCRWDDEGLEQDCGKCKASAWSGDALDCAANRTTNSTTPGTMSSFTIDPKRLRTRDLRCKFRLGPQRSSSAIITPQSTAR